MRIYLIPLTSKRALIYGRRVGDTIKPTMLDRLSARAGRAWLQMENGEKQWQKRLTDMGNKLFQRISYEEWSLKSIPALTAQARKRAQENKYSVSVIYPPSVVNKEDVPEILRKMGTDKYQMHRSKLIWSLIGLPITAPLGIIPIVPNIPFFYLAFRAYSHWKALKGGEHLQFLVKHNLIEPHPSPSLDGVYGPPANGETLSPQALSETLKKDDKDKAEGAEEETMLITKPHAKRVADILQTPQLVMEVERACEQVKGLLEQAKQKKAEEEKAKSTPSAEATADPPKEKAS